MDSKTLKKYFAGFLFGLICLVFVFFGLPQQMGAIGGGIVADVNGEVVSFGDYRDMRQRLTQTQGFNLSNLSGQFREMMQQRLNDQAVQYLVNNILVYQGAEAEGLYVSDEEVRDSIVQEPAFQEDGVFQRGLYRQYLKNARQSAGEFEHQIRMRRQSYRVQSVLQQVSVPTAQQVEIEQKLRQTKYNLEFLRINERSLDAGVQVSDAEIAKQLEDEGFAAKVKTDYDANSAKYRKEYEQVKAQHILFKTDPAKPESVEKALKKAQEVKSGLTAENFAEMAKKHSADTASAQKGGDLGFFSRGKMVAPFEAKAFSMNPGEISDPVKSQFGFHIILVNEKKDGGVESVRGELAKEMIKKDKTSQAMDKILAAHKEGNLEGLLKTYKLTWTETGPFDLSATSIPRLGDEDGFFTAMAKLAQGQKMSDPVEKDDTQFILRLKSREAVADVNVKDVEQSLSRELAVMLTNDWVQHLRESGDVTINEQLIR